MGIPSALTQRVRTGQAVLVAGLGFLDPVSARGWDPLLRRLAERFAATSPQARETARLIIDLVNRGRSATALAWLRRHLPEEVVKEVLVEVHAPGGVPPLVMDLATRLPWQGVVATCFNDVWERTLKNGRTRRLDPRQLAVNGGRLENGVNPFFLHALGTWSDPETLCFSPSDLRRRPMPAAVATFLRGLFAERSFVFLGFRPGDPDLSLIRHHMLGAAPSQVEHFLLLPEDSAVLDSPLQSDILGAEMDLVPVGFPGSLEELLRAWAGGTVDGPGKGSAADAGRALQGEIVQDAMSEARTNPVVQAPLLVWVREQQARIASTPAADRAPLYEEMGDVYRERFGNPVHAISCYRTAVQYEPSRRSALLKLVDFYVAHKHWPAAEDAVVRLAALEGSLERRVQLLCRAAAIAHDELDRPARAAQLLERALVEAPDAAQPFEAFERLLNQEKNWQALARLYQKSARELGQDGPGRSVKIRAMDGLAELALRFSKDPRVAIKALEAADSIDPDNGERKGLMATLYQQAGPEFQARAIATHHAAIAADPERLASFKALVDLYRAAGDRDRLWCMAATMTFLRKADEELRDIYERGKAVFGKAPARPVPPEVWTRVAHADADPEFSALFGALGPVLAGMSALTVQEMGLRPEERVDPAQVPGVVGRALATVNAAIDSPPLLVYLRAAERRPASVRIVRLGGELAPALVLGGPLGVTTDPAEAVLAIARSLLLLQPDRIVCGLEASRAVARVGLEAALQMAGLKPPAESLRGDVERVIAQVGALLPPATRDHIIATARRLVAQNGGTAPEVDRWCTGIELTATRVAFLLIHDLGAAARSLATEASSGQPLSAKQRLKDLIGFSVSETYLEARKMVGMAERSTPDRR
jgi:tetratricopeptide (TPR) repeat protein